MGKLNTRIAPNSEDGDENDSRRAKFERLIARVYDLHYKTKTVLLYTTNPMEYGRLENNLQQLKRDAAYLEQRRDDPSDTEPVPERYPFPGGMDAGTYEDLVELIRKLLEGVHNVKGLPNPYLGLRSYTYAESNIYAGREQTVEAALAKITSEFPPLPMLFITGASGSGKSSFARAGLIPALEEHYKASGYTVRQAVFRPSSQPLVMLTNALSALGLRPLDWAGEFTTAPDFTTFMAERTPQGQVNLLVLDQFEEVFSSQVSHQQLEILKAFLSALSDFKKLRTHLIVTLRSDYLGKLQEDEELYPLTKVIMFPLWKMREEELKKAILKPIQQEKYSHKRFEEELVEILAKDASVDATYLPLLQVTLERLWDKGSLKRAAYNKLTDAIKDRAEDIWQYKDYDVQSQPRSPEEQKALMQIMLDLISVSQGDDRTKDVRRSRSRAELEKDLPLRKQLIDDLVNGRLLSITVITQDQLEVEIVDIIHESLINNWDRFQKEIAENLATLKRQARFEQLVADWLGSNRNEKYLLTGGQLEEALKLDQDSIALIDSDGKDFLTKSNAADQARQRKRLQRLTLTLFGLGLLLVVAIVALVFALGNASYANEQRATAVAEKDLEATAEANAVNEKNQALALKIAAQSQYLQDKNFDLSLLLAAESTKIINATDGETRVRLANVLDTNPFSFTTLTGHSASVNSIAFSPDGKTLASVSNDHSIKLWDIATRKLLTTLTDHSDSVNSIAFSPDGKTLASGSEDKTIKLWDVTNPLNAKLLTTLTGHSETVLSVAFSPDGKTLASASGSNDGTDGTIKLWDVTNPLNAKLLTTLTGHSASVNSIAFSPDGKTLASASVDNTIKLWDVTNPLNAKFLTTLNGHSSIVNSIAFSPDGKTLASGSEDKTIKLWDVTNPLNAKLLTTLTGHSEAVLSVAFSPDGKTLASSSEDKSIKLWEVATRKPLTTLVGYFIVAFSPDGKTLATISSNDGTIKLWNVTNHLNAKSLTTLTGHSSYVYSVAFSPDGKTLASSSEDNTIKLWDVTNPLNAKLLTTLTGHSASVNSIAFSPDGKTLASASVDNTIKLWDVTNPLNAKFLTTLNGHSSIVNSIAFSPDGKTLASGSEDKTIKLWDVTNPLNAKLLTTLTGHSSYEAVLSVAFSPDGKTLASSSEDKSIKLWEVATRKLLTTLTGHFSVVYSVAFSPDGKTLASSSEDKTIKLWDVTNPLNAKLLTTLDPHSERVLSVAFSPDSKTLANSSYDGTIKLWDVTNPLNAKFLTTLTGHSSIVWSIAFSPDGKTLASSSEDKTIKLWDVTNPLNAKLLTTLTGHIDTVLSIAFSSDGKTLASASSSNDHSIKLWDVTNPLNAKLLTTLDPQSDAVYSVAFSPDGKTLASGNENDTIKLWDIATDKLLTTFTGYSSAVRSVAFSADDKTLILAGGSEDNTIKLWPIFSVTEQQNQVCQMVNRNLTKAEWDEYVGDKAYYNPICTGLLFPAPDTTDTTPTPAATITSAQSTPGPIFTTK